MAQPQQRPAEEEEDPLDAFMKTQVLEQAKKEAERAAAHQVAWRAQYGHKDVQITDAIEPDNDPNKHCYVCKKWGHTKKDCPNKRCRFCGQEGHFSEECEEKDRKIGAQFDKDKERKRQKAYAAKKAKKRAEWESQLRAKTGIEGYEVLYEILGLPPRKLATREAIRRAYRMQSLRYHPDKVRPEEAEEAAEKFLAVKAAYDLLVEGMETGGAGMKGAVFSGGDLEYRVPPDFGAPTEEMEAALFQEMESGAAVERLQQMAAAYATARGVAEDDDEEVGNADEQPQQDEIRWLGRAEVGALLGGEPRVLAAVHRIAADANALEGVLDDAVVMGVLYSVLATRREEVLAANTVT